MTTLTKCNKCGKTFRGFFNTIIKRYNYIEMIGHLSDPDIDICDDCDKLLLGWLEEK